MKNARIIPWHLIYNNAVDAAWLTPIVLRHAEVIAASAVNV